MEEGRLATRQEKYKHLRTVHLTKINDPYTRSTQVTKSTRTTKRIANRISRELARLSNAAKHSPNHLLTSNELETIKVSSETFSKIINDCSTFKDDLTNIKRCYDNRLDELLRSLKDPLSSNNDKDEALSVSTNTTTESELDSVKYTVHSLTDQILLEENVQDRLKEVLLNVVQSIDQISTLPQSSQEYDIKDNYSSKVDNLQCQILQKRKEMCESFQARTGLVSFSVCQRLEQCIHASELEIQKLVKMNQKLVHDIRLLEDKLRQYLEALHVPSNDLKLIWNEFGYRTENVPKDI